MVRSRELHAAMAGDAPEAAADAAYLDEAGFARLHAALARPLWSYLYRVVGDATQAEPVPHGVTIEVIDRGPGIAVEDRMRVFSRFWRSGPGAGSGLGMFIVAGIIDEHGGSLEITEGPGDRGANIRVWLPAAEPA